MSEHDFPRTWVRIALIDIAPPPALPRMSAREWRFRYCDNGTLNLGAPGVLFDRNDVASEVADSLRRIGLGSSGTLGRLRDDEPVPGHVFMLDLVQHGSDWRFLADFPDRQVEHLFPRTHRARDIAAALFASGDLPNETGCR